MARVLNKQSNIAPTSTTEALFMSIGEGAIVTDDKARISRINKIALDILGYSEDELLGRWFPEVVIAEDEQGNPITNMEGPMAQAYLTGKNVSGRAYYRRKDNSRVPVYLTVAPVMIGSRPVGAIEVFRDITHEITLERAKDEFVAIASHQLRTPATAVKQYLGLLLEGYAEPLTESQKLFLERAYESNERQLHIVQEILKITQLDLQKIVLKLTDQSIGDIVQEAVATVHSLFEAKKQKLILKLPVQPVIAEVDREQMRIAIENLLENASNYTREGKKITVSVRKLSDRIRIAVKDEGVGIAGEDIPRLFQKFSRIPNPLSLEISGTGLGLYWAAKIVELHNGYIRASSSLNSGSTFTINLITHE